MQLPRARNIKPAFFTNEYLAELPYEARLLFIGLWTLADRRGRLEDRPKGIKGKLFPYDEVDVEPLLQALADSPEAFIIRYKVDGQRYIQITNCEKHQHPHHRETGSTIPGPDKPQASPGLAPGQPGESPSDSFNLIPDTGLLIPDSGTMPGAVPAPDQKEPPFIEIPLNDGSLFAVYPSDIERWASLYPAVDIAQELRSYAGWTDANPKKRKTRGGIKKSINGWLAQEQNKGRALNGTDQQRDQATGISPGDTSQDRPKYGTIIE